MLQGCKVSRYSFLISIALWLAIAAVKPPDIKCINAFREKAKLHFGRNTENQAVYFARRVNHSMYVEFGRRSMLLHRKLVVVALYWLLELFYLKSNDVLDAVLSTDLGEQRCFKFLIRQLVSLSKTKIICSVADRKQFVACGFCGVKNSQTYLGIHGNIITAVNCSNYFLQTA